LYFCSYCRCSSCSLFVCRMLLGEPSQQGPPPLIPWSCSLCVCVCRVLLGEPSLQGAAPSPHCRSSRWEFKRLSCSRAGRRSSSSKPLTWTRTVSRRSAGERTPLTLLSPLLSSFLIVIISSSSSSSSSSLSLSVSTLTFCSLLFFSSPCLHTF
jgi:hypothetical protein